MIHHTLQSNQLTEVILVESSASFVEAFVTNFKHTCTINKSWKMNLKNVAKICSAEIILAEGLYSTDAFLTDMLKSASVALIAENSSLNSTKTVIRYKHYNFTFTQDVVDAIRQQAEVAYLVTCKLSKELNTKNIVRVKRLIEYFYNTCFTYYKYKSITTDKYYFATLQQPLPIQDIIQLCKGVHFILEQFNQVIKIQCTLKATGVTRDW